MCAEARNEIRSSRVKIKKRARAKIARVGEGLESGIYRFGNSRRKQNIIVKLARGVLTNTARPTL